MSIKDVIKDSFLSGYSATDFGTKMIITTLAFSCLLGIYIFFCYRIMTRRTFYSKSFASSLVAVCMIVSAIILSMQANVIVSLGMVGALSIVRFRTAIKDPQDLVYMFWSIAAGIICGVGLTEVALLLSLGLTIVLFILEKIPVSRAPKILIINSVNSKEAEDEIEDLIKKHTGYYKVKSKVLTESAIDWAVEIRTSEDRTLTSELSSRKNTVSVSLLDHDGEVNF